MEEHRNILLESGTNELEFVEFCVNDMYCGVNVAKVREIIRKPALRSMVGSPASVAGMINLRDNVLPVIDLCQILGQRSEEAANQVLILEFNRVMIGVLVHSVSRIYRISWKQVEAPSLAASGAYITGLVKMDGRIILMLDFERILAELYQEGAVMALELKEAEAAGEKKPDRKILVVDDSSFIRAQICSTLRRAGYIIEEAANGEEAWGYIDNKSAAGQLDIYAVITDVEMPKMDGLHLVTLIRSKAALAGMPVFVFSSLASEDNIRKWKQLEINGVLTKPDLPKLVDILKDCFEKDL